MFLFHALLVEVLFLCSPMYYVLNFNSQTFEINLFVDDPRMILKTVIVEYECISVTATIKAPHCMQD